MYLSYAIFYFMRIIDAFRHWKILGTLVLILLVIWLGYDNVNKQNEIWDTRAKISQIKSDYQIDSDKKDAEIKKLQELIQANEQLRAEMSTRLEEIEWEKEELNMAVNNSTENIETMKENSEWMVKVINNWTLLTEAIATYIKNHNNNGPDDFMTESAWKKVENTAQCYAENVNKLKRWLLVSNCY